MRKVEPSNDQVPSRVVISAMGSMLFGWITIECVQKASESGGRPTADLRVAGFAVPLPGAPWTAAADLAFGA
ncbi:hypothetical protein Ssi02_72230 [Sinosporangium siamense]|uniref:Uncharacterized protein n=1 Tax=Sinosporangium siamense TaxID=1367973 RepID=A0A919VBX2_9ACTN|nr:hypothetical protein Ssi02_72230 [Sinosporangium siamense]